MRYELVVPATADGALTVKVNAWYKKTGEKVTKGVDLVELITEKVSLYISSPVNGTLAEIISAPGSEIPVGAIVGYVEGDGA